MLTAKNISAKTAVEYFFQGASQKGAARWSGKGALKLGLSGAINNEKIFSNIAYGFSPDGSQFLNGRKLSFDKRRAALDCTFSAPKTVSLMALVGGDYRLIEAHQLAVRQSLDLAQSKYARTRIRIDGRQKPVTTDNLVIAEFDHIESRELDPQLHTHCLLMNLTEANGEWYSLSNTQVFKNKIFLGMAYQSFLAESVKKLGYSVEAKEYGQFDIKGFNEQQINAFSKRRQQILIEVGESASREEKDRAWNATRKHKKDITQSELKSDWQQQAKALEIVFELSSLTEHEPVEEIADHKTLEGALDSAIAHWSERNVCFKHEDLGKFIFQERLASNVHSIDSLIKQHKDLIDLPGMPGHYTTIKAVEREVAIIDLIKQGQDKLSAIALTQIIENRLAQTTLNSGQRQAVQLAATTHDQFVAWQGVAGAGKTFAVNELKAIALDAGYTVKGFAPNSIATKVLGEDTLMKTRNVASLLCSKLPPEPELNQLWIIDEAGLLSASDTHALLERAVTEQARVVFIGDTRQFSAVGAGNPFKLLQQEGIKTAHLTESRRQQNPELKLAVDLIADNRIQSGFKHLQAMGSIECVSPVEKLETIADDYIQASPEIRSKTLVLAGTNKERLALTQVIRSRLQEEGSLGQDTIITQLLRKDLTRVQMENLYNFEVGEVVMPTRDYKRRGLEKGKLYTVVGKQDKTLVLQSSDGNQFEVDTLFEKAIYTKNEIAIAKGDILRWRKNDNDLGRSNGEDFVVTAIDGDTATIKYLSDDGRTETLNLREGHSLDYAIVTTVYSSQGKTAERVLVADDWTMGKESFYVAASRAKQSLKIYTHDSFDMLQRVEKSKTKQNALEVLREQVRKKLAAERAISINIGISQLVLKTQVTVCARSKAVAVPPLILLKDLPVAASPVLKSQPVMANPVLETAYRGEQKAKEPILKKEHTTLPPVVKPILKKVTPDAGFVAKAFEKPVPKPAVPKEAFWTPDQSEEIADFIEHLHWQEFSDSAIHPGIAALNFESLKESYVGGEHEAWERLMVSDKLKRTNTGSLTKGLISAYSHLDAGGWWCDAGVDPRSFADLTPLDKPDKKRWGCYKPNIPRPKKDESGQVIEGKFIKYEHPPKVDLSIFLLDVPQEIADQIYSKYKINPTDSDRTSGFWYCVWKHNIPCTIAEGAKKAASLLSQGHAAIGLPGISAGYRSPKDEFGNKIGKSYLHSELAVFATKGREIKFCFDYETKSETKQNIERDISVTGSLLQKAGAKVKVVTLPGPDKGVDDFIMAQGPLAYEKVSQYAVSLRDWQYDNQQQSRTAFSPPHKLTPQERQQRLAADSTSVQKLSPQNQTKEQGNDINHQQPQQSATIGNRITNREDRSIVEQSPEIEHQNRATRNSQPTVESENTVNRTNTDGKVERIENEPYSVFGAISRHLEQQAILELEADLRELNRSLTSGELRGQRRSNIPANAHQLDSASPDSRASDVSFKSNANERVINAISNFLEIEEIASVIDVEGLQTKIRDLRLQEQPHAKANNPELAQKTLDAITNFVEQEQVSSVLVEALPSLTEQLSQYQEQLKETSSEVKNLQQLLKQQSAITKACEAIIQHAKVEEFESSKVVQTLELVVEELRQLPETMLLLKEVVTSQKSQISLNAIASYIEQESIEEALIEALPLITKELLLYEEQLVDENRSLNNLDQRHKEQLATTQAVKAIALNIEQSHVEVALALILPQLIEQLHQHKQQQEKVITHSIEELEHNQNQFPSNLTSKQEQQLTTDIEPKAELSKESVQLRLHQIIKDLDQHSLALLVMEVGKYVKGEFVTGEKVDKLFTNFMPPNLSLTFEQKMNMVRQVIRDDKPSIMEKLKSQLQQSNDSGEQINFQR